MVRVKTRYRKFGDGGAVPSEEEVTALIPTAKVESDHHSDPDDASVAFQRQIDQLRLAEGSQRQRVAIESFLRSNSDMIQHPEVLRVAEEEVHQHGGHLPYSPEFYAAVKSNFDDRLHRSGAPVAPGAVDEALSKARQAVTAKPEFDPSDLPVPERKRSSFVSAPVSREVPIAYGSDRPGRVTLSIEEKDMARRSGISEADYAQGKLDTLRRRAAGEYDR